MKKKKFDDVLYIKLPKQLKNKVIKEADKQFKNTSEYVRDILIKEIEG